jgi:hypothetical protein
MENQGNQKIYPVPVAFRYARKGFLLMLSGPALLLIAGLFVVVLGELPAVLAFIIGGTAFLLPGIGVVFAIKALIKRDELYKTGRALAIITCVMCNPLFYFIYFFICFVSGSALAGMASM